MIALRNLGIFAVAVLAGAAAGLVLNLIGALL